MPIGWAHVMLRQRQMAWPVSHGNSASRSHRLGAAHHFSFSWSVIGRGIVFRLVASSLVHSECEKASRVFAESAGRLPGLGSSREFSPAPARRRGRCLACMLACSCHGCQNGTLFFPPSIGAEPCPCCICTCSVHIANAHMTVLRACISRDC